MPPAARLALVLLGSLPTLRAQHEGVTTPPTSAASPVDFARDVRPILTQHCFGCHGPDEKKRKADLRLDRRLDAFATGDDGAAFVAKDPAASLALSRVLSTDPEERMPPPDAGDALTTAQIDVLTRWIAEGASWPEHWAFTPPQRPAVPTVVDEAWPTNDVDRFVLAKLEAEGLRPSAPATRESWLRRVTFDLIGLPPTPQEIDDFLRDTSAEAHGKVVDRLLADKRYGERQASEWLDVARYADSSGYQRDTPRIAWKWRDWVIDALNANMPFDQFTIEQLAGDLLPDPTLAQRIATGFNRNHPVNTEAGEELDEYRSAYVIDRVHTTTTTWLGLSVACAQCHDHKYDPISQREFYSFYGFFNHVKERDSGGFARNPKPSIPAPGPDDVPRLADLDRRIKTLETRLEKDDPLADAAQAAWEKDALARLGEPVAWTHLDPTELMARHGSRLKRLEDGSILATGPVPARDTYELVFSPGKRKIHALRIEVLPDPSLPHGASGRADDGRFILQSLQARLASTADSSDPPLIAYALAAADVNQKRDEEEHYLTAIEPGSFAGSIAIGDGDEDGGGGGFRFGGGWSIAGDERKEPREAILIPIETLDANDTSILRLTLHQSSRSKFKSMIGRFRVSFTEDPRVRTQLVAVSPSLWRALGPFPAVSVDAAFATAFPVEKDLTTAEWKKKYDQPILPKPEAKPAEGKATKPSAPKEAGKPEVAAPDAEKPSDKPAEKGEKDAVAVETPEAVDESAKPAAKMPKFGKGQKPTPPSDDTKDAKDEATPAGKEAGENEGKASEKPAAKPATDKAAAAPEKDKPATEKPPEKPKPRRLEWAEHRDWRDGDSARLAVEGPASAWYVARKLRTEVARTITIELEGGVGAKVWLNGNVVAEYAPPIERPEPDAKAAKEAAAKAKEEPDDDEAFAMAMRGNDREPRFLRLGLRAGENHLVIKLIGKGAPPRPSRGQGDEGPGMGMEMDAGDAKFGMRRGGGGLSFTFEMKAEGDDLLDFETLTALRLLPADRSAAPTAPSSPVAAEAPVAAMVTAPIAIDATATAVATTAPDKSPPTPAERRAKVVRKWYRTRIDIAGRVLFEELERLKKEKERIEAKLPQALVMEELAKPRPTHLFVRGDYRKKGELVETGTPAALPPMPSDLPRNRLGLARWLVGKDNPLTARVTVNRAWQQFFGLGIVRTADDFGVRGAQPSNQPLLDWLACEFATGGWDRKKLHRMLVLSSTYRQTGAVTPELLERDPDNVLLARGPAQRLSAEMIRDQALFASGLLVDTIGGPSVKPYQPPGLWKSVLGSGEWKMDKGDALYRRGLYVYWKRGVPYPSFTAFDASKRETCTVTRTRTTTPLQALVLLNDPVYVEAGRALGQRMWKDGGKDDDARLQSGFRHVTSRRADERELAALRKLLTDMKAHFAADEKASKALLTTGAFPTDEKFAPAEAAAWAVVGSVLLNLEAAIRRG